LSIIIHKTNFLVHYNFTYNGMHIKPIRKCALLCYSMTQKHCHLYVIRSQRLICRDWHTYSSKFNRSFNWIKKSNNFIYSINSTATSSYLLPRMFCFPNYVSFLSYDAHSHKVKVLFIIKDSWLRSDPPHSVGNLWTTDQRDAGTGTW